MPALTVARMPRQLLKRNGVDTFDMVEKSEMVEQARRVLAKVWETHTTDDGREYYYNVKTQNTTWERPY